MSKPYPKEFRDDVVRVARNRGPDVDLEQIAKDFGIHFTTLYSWLKKADIEDGKRAGSATQRGGGAAGSAAADQDSRAGERGAAPGGGVFRSGASAGKMSYPLVRELAADGIPVTVTCRVLKLARQPYYRWLANPVTDAEWVEAHLADAMFDAHRDDPEFGYRFLADEARDAGLVFADRTAWRICRDNGWWRVFGKKRRGKKRQGRDPGPRRPGPPRLHRPGPEPTLGHRHHRTPHLLDSSSRRNTWWRWWRWRVRSTRQEQKEMFFELIDRGGTVRAAAKAVGVHEDAAYTWLRQAGLSMQRATPRKYTEEEKAEFFRLVAERQIISTVARELGIHSAHRYSWAARRGSAPARPARWFRAGRSSCGCAPQGLTRAEARARVGADNRSATDWDKGITIINRGRIYPDGRVVRYPLPPLDTVRRDTTTHRPGDRRPSRSRPGREGDRCPLPEPARA